MSVLDNSLARTAGAATLAAAAAFTTGCATNRNDWQPTNRPESATRVENNSPAGEASVAYGSPACRGGGFNVIPLETDRYGRPSNFGMYGQFYGLYQRNALIRQTFTVTSNSGERFVIIPDAQKSRNAEALGRIIGREIGNNPRRGGDIGAILGQGSDRRADEVARERFDRCVYDVKGGAYNMLPARQQYNPYGPKGSLEVTEEFAKANDGNYEVATIAAKPAIQVISPVIAAYDHK